MKLDESQLAEMKHQLNTWMELKSHPGWQAFEATVKREEQKFLDGATKLGQSPNDMALQLGSWKVANAYRTFVDRNIQQARLMLDAHSESEKHEDPRKHV